MITAVVSKPASLIEVCALSGLMYAPLISTAMLLELPPVAPASSTGGMMGRTPDYLNVTFACFAGASSVWARRDNEQGAANHG